MYMTDILDKVVGALDSVVSAIGSVISTTLGNLIGTICYYLTCGACTLVRIAYSVFSIFSGITKVSVDGEYQYLTNFFFENNIVTGIYWGMVMIGIVLVFAFAIVSVIRKMFDLYDRQQHSIGQILSGCFKAIFIMLCLTMFMSIAMSLTNELVRRVNYVFDENETLTEKNEVVFTDEQYATMARILNTIGNYSLNPSYNQRFNLNACYNEIRPDLLILQEQGVFDIVYTDTSDSRSDVLDGPCWQSALEELAMAGNPSELMMDPYYDQISKALLNIMDTMRNDASFKPISSFSRKRVSTQDISLDTIVFLSGTMNAANNDFYNINPSMDDAVRGPFLHEDRSIYDLDEVSSVFNVRMGGISYLMIWFTTFFVLQSLMRTILNCASRLINIVGLYVIAPPVAAAIPLDDGQKFKEWITSMVIQMLGIFGSIIPMRLVLLFLPMILDDRFVLSSSITINLLGKVLLIVGLLKGVDRFGGILTGILANSAGQAAIRASDLDEDADKIFDKYIGQHVPGLRNFASPLYKQKQSEQGNGGGGNGGSHGGSSGGSSGDSSMSGASFGGSVGGALPGRAAQYSSMNQSSNTSGVSGLPGSRPGIPSGGNLGSRPGIPSGGNLGGRPGNLPGGNLGSSGNLPGSAGKNSVPGAFGLPGKAPSAAPMSHSNPGYSSKSGTSGLPGNSNIPGTSGNSNISDSPVSTGSGADLGGVPGNLPGSLSGSDFGGDSANDFGNDYGGNFGSSFGNDSGAGSPLPEKAAGADPMSQTGPSPDNPASGDFPVPAAVGSSFNDPGAISGPSAHGNSDDSSGNLPGFSHSGSFDLPGKAPSAEPMSSPSFGAPSSNPSSENVGGNFSSSGGFGHSGSFDLPGKAPSADPMSSPSPSSPVAGEFSFPGTTGSQFGSSGSFDLPGKAPDSLSHSSAASDSFGGNDFGGSHYGGNDSGGSDYGGNSHSAPDSVLPSSSAATYQSSSASVGTAPDFGAVPPNPPVAPNSPASGALPTFGSAMGLSNPGAGMAQEPGGLSSTGSTGNTGSTGPAKAPPKRVAPPPRTTGKKTGAAPSAKPGTKPGTTSGTNPGGKKK